MSLHQPQPWPTLSVQIHSKLPILSQCFWSRTTWTKSDHVWRSLVKDFSRIKISAMIVTLQDGPQYPLPLVFTLVWSSSYIKSRVAQYHQCQTTEIMFVLPKTRPNRCQYSLPLSLRKLVLGEDCHLAKGCSRAPWKTWAKRETEPSRTEI